MSTGSHVLGMRSWCGEHSAGYNILLRDQFCTGSRSEAICLEDRKDRLILTRGTQEGIRVWCSDPLSDIKLPLMTLNGFSIPYRWIQSCTSGIFCTVASTTAMSHHRRPTQFSCESIHRTPSVNLSAPPFHYLIINELSIKGNIFLSGIIQSLRLNVCFNGSPCLKNQNGQVRLWLLSSSINVRKKAAFT